MTSEEFTYPRVLSIAGSDSGGGAGIQADLKTFGALGCYGMTAITALTAQNTCGVRRIEAVSAAMVGEQIDAVVEDIGVDAVKIGMLPNRDVVATVAAALERHHLSQVVLDPVMVASSGARLMDAAAIDAMVRELFPRVTVITPNLPEAAVLLGRAVKSVLDMESAAGELLRLGARAVLLKGGHLSGDEVVDVLLVENGETLHFYGARIPTVNSHGTGCTLSSAIAAGLALGMSLAESVATAREFVRVALETGARVKIGQGSGPLNHGHAPTSLRPVPGVRRLREFSTLVPKKN